MSSNRLDSFAALCTVVTCAVVAFATLRRGATEPTMIGSDPPTVQMPSQWVNLTRHGVRLSGSAISPIQLVEFSDLECPFCKRLHETLEELPTTTRDSISVTFVHYPLTMHRFARKAAQAAECAEREGRFSAIVRRTFELQDSLGLKSWTEMAMEAGVTDTIAFTHCLSEPEHPRIAEGRRVGDSIKVRATPTVVLNGIRFGGTPTRAQLDSAIAASRVVMPANPDVR